ncbi:nucleotidyltransferase family protein [Jannaschia sp. Os4]|uniref:nucleotidyltransferase family protein n=1 Tax=Jannaschia sp. Os4 TaxID=2807617 RepID=UPI0019392D68|nr:nucleotidyltransferase family protein [Jannaschia sp. Os4]MBM2575829.1 nucleotidyltransferase family protein [Jannaschia sp. Os4]
MIGGAMVFAAGLGTRMAPLTDTRPKALVEVAGRPLIDHALDQVPDGPTVVNLHHFADQLRAHLGTRATLVEEPGAPLETGGGLANARDRLGPDPIMTLNSDAVWTGAPAHETLARAWRDDMEALLLLVPATRATGHAGSDFEMRGTALAFAPGGWVYTGAALMRTDRLARHGGAFSLSQVWRAMAADGTLHGVVHPGGWADVGRPVNITLAEAMLAAPQ